MKCWSMLVWSDACIYHCRHNTIKLAGVLWGNINLCHHKPFSVVAREFCFVKQSFYVFYHYTGSRKHWTSTGCMNWNVLVCFWALVTALFWCLQERFINPFLARILYCTLILSSMHPFIRESCCCCSCLNK